MRMSLMFAAVTLLTGINLIFIPFQPVPALWGAILAVAFVLINVVAEKLLLWSGMAWIIVAGIIITLMLKGKEPGDELRVLIRGPAAHPQLAGRCRSHALRHRGAGRPERHPADARRLP